MTDVYFAISIRKGTCNYSTLGLYLVVAIVVIVAIAIIIIFIIFIVDVLVVLSSAAAASDSYLAKSVRH